MDELFERDVTSVENGRCVAAAPDVFPPDKFNAGVLVLSPHDKVVNLCLHFAFYFVSCVSISVYLLLSYVVLCVVVFVSSHLALCLIVCLASYILCVALCCLLLSCALCLAFAFCFYSILNAT